MHNGSHLLKSVLNYNTKITKVNGGSKFLSIIIFQIFFALGLKPFKHCVVRSFNVHLDFFKLFQQCLLFLLSFLPFSLVLGHYWMKKFVFLQEKCEIIETMHKTEVQEQK